METFNAITEWADKFTIWVALVTVIFTLINYHKNKKLEKKLNQNIQIILKHPESGQSHRLAQTIKRRYASRAEIQGLLANVYSEDKRYNIPYMRNPEYSEQIEAIQNGKSDALTITIEDEQEYQKFL